MPSGRDLLRRLQSDGTEARAFAWGAGEALWPALQTALQQMRAAHGGAGIAAVGSGCAAALALAEQLPVDRLALLFPRRAAGLRASGGAELWRQVGRLERYALMNLPLCVSDILMVCRAKSGYARRLRACGLRANSRLIELCIPPEKELKFIEDSQNGLNSALSGFLRTGDLPKSLAENPEMCIIYG